MNPPKNPTKNSELEMMVRKTHDTVVTLNTAILGVPGTQDKGLCGKVDRQGRELYSLKKHFWILVGFLVGLGVVSGGAYGLMEVLKTS